MKIGIDARIISHPQTGGYKTYTTNLVKALARFDRTCEYVLYFDRPFAEEFPLPENFATKIVPAKLRYAGAAWREQYSLPRAMRRDGVDISHFPCNTGPLGRVPNLVISLHDVITLTANGGKTPAAQKSLRQRLLDGYDRTIIPRAAAKASRIITVSEYAKRQIILHLGAAAEKVSVVYQTINPALRPFSESEQAAAQQRLLEKYRIAGPFLLGMGYHPRKNIHGLLKAYQTLEEDYRTDLSLVIIVSHEAGRRALLRRVMQQGLSGRVVIVGQVGDEELIDFYNAAAVFVFPSYEEGFGLPPLEAMACGTPVVTSNRSSLPEVTGEAGICVDPSRADEIAAAVYQVIDDSDRAAELKVRGLARAKQFSAEQTARQTLQVYRDVYLAEKTAEGRF